MDELVTELKKYLDSIVITSDNIGSIRYSLFVPWPSAWNAAVRDETAARELAPDSFCVTTDDGDCISTDDRCMHQEKK